MSLPGADEEGQYSGAIRLFRDRVLHSLFNHNSRRGHDRTGTAETARSCCFGRFVVIVSFRHTPGAAAGEDTMKQKQPKLHDRVVSVASFSSCPFFTLQVQQQARIRSNRNSRNCTIVLFRSFRSHRVLHSLFNCSSRRWNSIQPCDATGVGARTAYQQRITDNGYPLGFILAASPSAVHPEDADERETPSAPHPRWY